MNAWLNIIEKNKKYKCDLLTSHFVKLYDTYNVQFQPII